MHHWCPPTACSLSKYATSSAMNTPKTLRVLILSVTDGAGATASASSAQGGMRSLGPSPLRTAVSTLGALTSAVRWRQVWAIGGPGPGIKTWGGALQPRARRLASRGVRTGEWCAPTAHTPLVRWCASAPALDIARIVPCCRAARWSSVAACGGSRRTRRSCCINNMLR